MAPPSKNRRVFGQATRYQRQAGQNYKKRPTQDEEQQRLAQRRAEYRRQRQAQGEALDAKFGYERFDHKSAVSPDESRRGWLFNIMPTTVSTAGSGGDDHGVDTTSAGPERSGLDLYFLMESGFTFKSTVLYDPYFYVVPSLSGKDEIDHAVIFENLRNVLLRSYEQFGLASVEVQYMQDLDQVNHLSPKFRKGRPMLKLIFDNVQQLMEVRRHVSELVKKNKQRQQEEESTLFLMDQSDSSRNQDPLGALVDMREYDVPYLVRVCTDLNIRAGAWYTVTPNLHDTGVALSEQDVERKANPTFFAFDIECTKAPLKFPDANVDSIFMISYMVQGQGYLILSKHVVSQDIQDFEYTPKPTYPGPFHIFNEESEEGLLKRFFSEYQRLAPQIVVTYNGDFFDWPFLEQRAALYGLDLYTDLGVEKVNEEYRGRCSVHLDAFHWVQRDSYLPQGAQGLKAVTKYKLGYDPVEVDPEDMVRFAQERPVHMATYSVSDAVATYYLYEKYVHLFIFSLCTIIPMGPEDVLRKGSGTLCETLLMVQAAEKSIIFPNKQTDPLAKFHDGHLLEAETYIGGKVECLETGVYRSDVEYKFDLKPSAFQGLIDNIDRDLTFAIEVEGGMDRTKIVNYDEIRAQIVEELEMLRDRPNRVEKPYIYHLDVGAMYPNIILTNRLQPSAIVDDATCAACDFNQSKNECKRKMDWVWRGDYTPASKNEYDRTKDQLSREIVRDGLPFHALDEKEQAGLITSRLKIYARNAYKKTKITEEETRKDTVCMRENDFYVDTVRRFRDRRYEYKKMTKSWKGKIGSAQDAASKKEAEDRALVYDSLQVAHKCILNSFYGYVMRKGARWRSMEMAGIVTKTGADLITQARILVEQIGRPLELDTDGIWAILPQSFPDVYNFKTVDGKKLKLEYPCVMLNADVHDNFTNHQYQTLKDPDKRIYETRSECSIFFEVDGPYRCMVLPSSTEEGKLLKKRYAVFNFDGSLAELKGFELKRRGELELIKTFQSQVFQRFLDGNSLLECYESVAEVANHWIDVLDTHGESLETDELFDLICENRSMSRQLEDYGDHKGTSQTTARRLGEFLGAEIIKDKGLNCKFIIAEQPYGAPVTERAIPTAIWKAEPGVMKHYLRKWLKSPGLEDDELDIRNVLDWEYYTNRLAKTIQKIITIPAALQKLPNPVPRVAHPAWLHAKVRQLNDRYQQQSIRSMFGVKSDLPTKSVATDSGSSASALGDIEDFGKGDDGPGRPIVHTVKRRDRRSGSRKENEEPNVEVASEQRGGNDRIELSKESFSDWLKQKKASWRRARKERRKRIHSSGNGGHNIGAGTGQLAKKQRLPASSMEGYIRDAAIALTQSEWQVVEIREMSSHDSSSSHASASGEFLLWVMVGKDSLQKIHITVPRIVCVTARKEITLVKDYPDIIEMKRVERHLPHGKSAEYIYEIKLSEFAYRKKNWTAALRPIGSSVREGKGHREDVLESIYETCAPLMLRALTDTGCVLRISPSASSENSGKGRKSYSLSDLRRVNRPSDGEYLHDQLSYKRLFLYVSVNARTKTGIVTLFVMDGGSGVRGQNSDDSDDETHDLTRPEMSPKGSFHLNSSCHVWVVKPGSRKGQKNLSTKHCESLFVQLLETIQGLSSQAEAAGQKSEYSCVSPESRCRMSSLSFVDRDDLAFNGANEVLNSYAQSNHGPTFLLLNSSKPLQQLRRAIPSFNSFPVVSLPFPPGPAHNASMTTLPSLNWEPTAVQLCLEAYFYMGVVSFPKRVSYSRYGNVPIGNLGNDETVTMYDVDFNRQLQKSRTISWASEIPNSPDLGYPFLSSTAGGDNDSPTFVNDGEVSNQNELWGDDDELISPAVRRPGAYRCICADIDVHDLAIAALTDPSASTPVFAPSTAAHQHPSEGSVSLPTSVPLFDSRLDGYDSPVKTTGPLGDEMSTAVSLPLLRAVVNTWLRDAYDSNSQVADDMLHHVYRLISSPEPLLNDPALHRVLHSLMKSTFLRLLAELQRLGCSIICATFHKVTVATNKTSLADAEEYVNFVISTIRRRSESGNGNPSVAGLGRIALRSNSYYSQYLFLDEYNFGGIQFERRQIHQDKDIDWVIPCDEEGGEPIVPAVVSGWNIMHYLASEIAQEYFRIIVGRFSKDVLRKQMQIEEKNDALHMLSQSPEADDELLSYKKKLISKHFASYLTRAVDEIDKDGGGPESFPRLPGSYLELTSPPLEFIKSVMVVLELDSDVQKEVHTLKKSLLAQIGVQEYSVVTKWVNPCASFMLPDVFCTECYESRDINLCILPRLDDEEAPQKRHWECEDCGTPYDSEDIERRLIDIVDRRTIRYQLQDVRCSKTGSVGTRAMSKQSDSSEELMLDIPREQAATQLRIVHNLAEFHELEWLNETTRGLMRRYR